MEPFQQTISEIKSLKIQGATNIARAALKALLEVPGEKLSVAIEQLISARPTEPLLENSLNLVRLKGKSVIGPTLARIDDVEGEIVKNGLPTIKEGSTILTHCHSSTVVALLKKAKKKGINFKVFLTETRPAFQGRITAQELVEAGISATMITDSEAAFLVSREDNKEIDIVLLGADAINIDGGAFNKVGSYGIALSASQAKIPLYIVTSLLKFSGHKVEIEERPQSEVWPNKPANLEIFNPGFDFIPAKLINSYLCEFGKIPPAQIKKVVKKNYRWIFDLSQKRKEKKKVSPYLSYLHLKENVKKEDYLVAHFLLTPEKKSELSAIAGGVAAESSVGTWTEVLTEEQIIFDKLHARVIELEEKSGYLEIAYPLELFEQGNIPQLLSSVAGNIFGLKGVKNLKLVDLTLPEKYVKTFPGPFFGLEGIRNLTGVYHRPMIGCIVKPKLGLNPLAQSLVAQQVFEGGVDFVKDDENLTSQSFNPFIKRVKEISKRCQFFLKQGRLYAFNVTGPAEVMEKRAHSIKSHQGHCLMIDFLTAGFSGLQYLRNRNLGLIIHGHRAMHAALDRQPLHGISMLVLAKLARLAGTDSLHTGTVVGKMEGGASEVEKINKFLLEPWYNLKPVLPVASGGLHPGFIPKLTEIFGNNILLNFGGGIHGHPQGSKAGAIAVLEAVKATQKKESLLERAKTSEELALALSLWQNISWGD
jgi:ribulose-bisphosphate carboxylase large chain